MDGNVRFRNHISIVAERMGKGFWVVLALLVGGSLQNLNEVMELTEMGRKAGSGALLGMLGALLLLILLAVWQMIIWARTYISIDGTTLVIERNTLNRKKNTIGIGNISNVNTEQNLFEMLIGTCKIKIDTNSLSTADSTDVKIVLKKKEAEEFCRYIAQIMEDPAGRNAQKSRETTAVSGEQAVERMDLTEVHGSVEEVLRDETGAALGAMLIHGFYQASLMSVLVVVVCIAGAVMTAVESLGQGNIGKSLAELLIGGVVVAFVFLSAIWDIIKGFIQYYDFKVRRRDDKLYISYGLLKKISYTVPVDKINALKLTQSFQGRLTGRCMAEIINVGMGDDQEEKKSFLLLYDKKEKNEERIEELLPEFSGVMRQETERQPGTVWGIWLIWGVIWILLTAGGAGVAGLIWEEYRIWIIAAEILIIAVTGIALVCRYRTAGLGIGEEFLLISQGYMGRRFLAIRFGKIQYLQLKQNFLAKRWRIQKGTVHLLASSLDRDQKIPYFRETVSEQLKTYILEHE